MPRERSLLRIDGGWHNATTSIARGIVGGRCSALIHLDGVRHHPAMSRASHLAQWGDLLRDTGIDPLNDVERVFVTAKAFNDSASTALVIDLAFDDVARVDAAFGVLARRAEPISTRAPRVVRTTSYGIEYVVALFGRSLVALPETEAARLPELQECRGLPLPRSDEAVSVFAEEPHVTLEGTLLWPEQIVEARADLRLSRWGASIDFVAKSSSAAQAVHDALTLELLTNEQLKLDLVVVQLPLHERLTFETHGDQIEMSARFSRAEIEVLLALGNL